MPELKPSLEELIHSGVKGMKWGVRKDTRATRKRYNAYNKGMKILDRHRLKKMVNPTDRNNYINEKDKKWMAKVELDKNIQKVSKRSAREMRKVNKELKKQFGGTGLKGNTARAVNGRLNAAYMKEMKSAYDEVLADHTFAVYKLSPSRTREVELKALSDGTIKATIVERSNPKLTKQRAAIVKAAKKLSIKQAKAEAKAKAKAEAEAKASLTHADQTDAPSNLDGMFFIIKLDADGFPDEVLSPFDDLQQSATLEDILQQSGIKGMKWGVRNETPIKSKGKLRQHLDSLKRERAWGTLISEMHNMPTKDIQIVKKRIDLENSLKRLSKTKIASAKDKQDYLRRAEMDDHELSRKVTRLQAKDNLYKSVRAASQTQREFGQKVVQIGGSLGMKYAINKKLEPADFFDAAKNPKEAGAKAKKDAISLATGKITNPKLKTAVDTAQKLNEIKKANTASNDKAKS